MKAYPANADRRRVRAGLCLAACAVAVLWGLAAPSANADVSADSIGVYSEELERGNSVNPLAASVTQRVTGIGLVRQPFSWARIETAPGELNFSVYDDVMAAAAVAGIAVLPVIMDPPPWRSTAPAGGRTYGMYPPRDPLAMAGLAAALVQRYGPSGSFWAVHPELRPSPIRSWQVWNEPNIRAFWATGPDPVAYVRLLAAVGAAIRAVDPTAEIVAAGLPLAGSGLTIAQFIDGMYAAGARGTFDTLAIHPYAPSPAGVLEVLRAARVQLDRLGDPDRPIWATEFGWATGGPPVTITMSEPAQATLVREAIVLMQRARSALRLRGFVVFRWRDVPLNAGQTDVWALHTGLLRLNGSPKPALDAFRDALATWRREPTPAEALSLRELARLTADAGRTGAGISRRSLRVRRDIIGGRLHVRVDVSPGGGKRRVRIAFEAIRDGRVVVHRARRVGTRKRVALAVFKLSPRARSSQSLRITASHGSASTTRLVPMDPRRRPSVR